MTNAKITINGKQLSVSQNETLRTALLSFCYQLKDQKFRDALGVKHALAVTSNLTEIISLIDEVDVP